MKGSPAPAIRVLPVPRELARQLPSLAGCQWETGARNGAALHRDLNVLGFAGSLRVATEWATRRRRAEAAKLERLSRTPSARTISRLLTFERDQLTRTQTITIAAIEQVAPALVEARELMAAFHVLIRRKKVQALDDWLDRASASLISSFTHGLPRDHHAVRAATATAWSNAQAESQITKLKLVKRQMYGRGKFDLLQAHIIGVK